jgi:hypothetical protein
MRGYGKIVWLGSLAVNLIWVLIVFASLNTDQLSVYFNSDTLYLPSIFRDVFVDNSGFRGWHLNSAPNFFPDMLVYFIFNWFLGDFKLSMVVFSICQYMFLLLMLNYLLKTVFSDISWYVLSMANLLMLIIFFVSVFTRDFTFTFYILSISYHLGVFIMAMLCLIFSIRYFKGEGDRYLYFLFVIGFLATLSNRLFIVMFVFPSVAALIFFAVKEYYRKTVLFLVAVATFSVAGIVVFNLIKVSRFVRFASTSGKMFNFSSITDSFNVMTGQHLRYLYLMDFRGVTVLLSLISFIVLCFIALIHSREVFIKHNRGYEKLTETFYVYFCCLFFLIVLFMPVINGSYVGWALLRYNIYVFYLSLFNYAYIFNFLFRRETSVKIFSLFATAMVTIMAGFTLYHAKITEIGKGLSSVINHYPEYIECIDEFAESRGLTYGVAGYWHAKMITMFSRKNVRLYTVHENMNIWYHVTNSNWYYKNGRGAHANPEFRFVILNSLESDAIKSLGEPVFEHQCTPPWIAGRETSENLRINEYPEFLFDPATRRLFFPDTEKE